MFQSLRILLTVGAVFLPFAATQADLVGTWSTKSRSVFTGPGFYDPVNEKMFEPNLTGISYSFTDDGHYEEAYYRAVSNPTTPQCPQGIIQWQHGTFQKLSNGSLVLTPFGVDGRQLHSDPCAGYSSAVLTRYNQPEIFLRYSAYLDPYSNVQRLDLYQFNGAPMNAMYLAYQPPQMLPTITLNPTVAASTATGVKATSTGNTKRSFDEPAGFEFREPLNKDAILPKQEPNKTDKWWWFGVGLTAIGSVGYFCF